MFTGIVENIGKVVALRSEQSNLHITIESSFTDELKIDQSIAHNGACLTVVEIIGAQYGVTAIDETLKKTNLGLLQIGDIINLERCLLANARIDGHIVQGHVDTTASVTKVENMQGSWNFFFEYPPQPEYLTVSKGSICVNGVSLTVVDSGINTFSVSIIPYTFENTGFKFLKEGDMVNIEFDILGKYIAKLYKK
ncbi:MAG: riboflavin synthase [Bacteroidetes bacterium]|nr:riboflavin synthase [Bacteroidota bacterium]